jgi:hypothetical protein
VVSLRARHPTETTEAHLVRHRGACSLKGSRKCAGARAPGECADKSPHSVSSGEGAKLTAICQRGVPFKSISAPSSGTVKLFRLPL